jgi:hypothetical protein
MPIYHEKVWRSFLAVVFNQVTPGRVDGCLGIPIITKGKNIQRNGRSWRLGGYCNVTGMLQA